jgi:hypothetical protein
MNNQDNNIKATKSTDDSLDTERLTWEEYKYRHELCWNLLFKITLVATTLSIIPYLNNAIITEAKHLVIFTPLIAIAISVIGAIRLSGELKLLDKIRYIHRKLQNAQFIEEIHTKKEIKELGAKSKFTIHVKMYMFFLTCLSILNFIIMLCTV